jgi:putative membrane protein
MASEHSILPSVNAFLNTLSAVLLTGGWVAIKSQKSEAKHKRFMIAAMISSTLFLTFYVLNRILVGGLTRYEGEGIMRGIYFFILGTHTPLAMIILPASFMALWHAYKRNFKAHVGITRWLLPVWIYVSVTGVLIYILLYVL